MVRPILTATRRGLGSIIPERLKEFIRAVEFLMVYFGFVSPMNRAETKGDEILRAVLTVRQELRAHRCRQSPFAEAMAFTQRLCTIYEKQQAFQPPKPYRIGKIWDAALRKTMKYYLSVLESGNAKELLPLLHCFHRNDANAVIGLDIDAIRGIFSRPFRSAAFVANLISKYQAFPRIADERFLRYIEESEIGCAVSVQFDGRRLSTNGIRHAYYASELSRASSLDQQEDIVIVEIGAGHGDLARLIKSVYPNKNVTYVILDIPQTLPLASYFLRANFPGGRFGLWDELRSAPFSRSDLLKYDFVLLPNWDIERLPDLGINVVVNTASLAEMDSDIVENYLSQIRRIIRSGGHFYTVNRNRGVVYDVYGGAEKEMTETGMNVWNLEWPGWSCKMNRLSWGDLHWGAWERMDYNEIVMEKS